MKRRAAISLLAAAATGGLSKTSDAKVTRRLTVVELFTSQGCSSCPPADRVLGELSRRPDILALSFHVDYWNYIGWQDPFSSPKWSQRQRRYTRALDARTYTPQLVVDGRAEMVGSRRRLVRDSVAQAGRQLSPSGIHVSVERQKAQALVRVSTATRRGEVLLGVVEDGHVTRVQSGENGGEVLSNQAVVRTLDRAFDAAKVSSQTHTLTLSPAWKGPLRVVVLQQDPRSMAMLDAAAVRLT